MTPPTMTVRDNTTQRFGLNVQPPEKIVTDNKFPLEVVKVWKTIQGEGPFAGRPAVFVRLAGCNLQCPKCDTDYTSSRKSMSTHDLYAEVVRVSEGRAVGLVVFTGGEPFRQPIGDVVREFTKRHIDVQIETNGTLYQEDFPYLAPTLTIVCSPKTPKIDDDLTQYVHYYKYVLQSGAVDPEDGLPTHVLGAPCKVARPSRRFSAHPELVYVQPMDLGDDCMAAQTIFQMNVNQCLDSAMKFGYRVSLQTHKILGVE